MAGLGVRGLRDLIPQNDSAGKASQFYSMAQNQHYIPQGNSGEKSASGAIMSGLGGVMAGQSLSTMLPAAAAAAPGAATATAAAAGGSAAASLAAGEAALTAGAGLSTAAVAPWAVGALALGSYLFG